MELSELEFTDEAGELADAIWKTIMDRARTRDEVGIDFNEVGYALAKVLGDVAALGDNDLFGRKEVLKVAAMAAFREIYDWRMLQDTFPKSKTKESEHGTVQ